MNGRSERAAVAALTGLAWAVAAAAGGVTEVPLGGHQCCAGCAGRVEVDGNDAQIAIAREMFVQEVEPRVISGPDGEVRTLRRHVRVRQICGSESGALSTDQLRDHFQQYRASKENPGQHVVVDTTPTGRNASRAGFNIIFQLSGDVPTEAIAATATVEQFLENNRFFDTVTIEVPIEFQQLNPGTLGSTGSFDLSEFYNFTRDQLIADMDADDTIEAFLPSGTTIPVRYTGNSPVVTNENIVYINEANYSAFIEDLSGDDGFMNINTLFTWDWDPTDGTTATCYQSVLIHEVAHLLGFTSGADFRTTDIEMLDLYRFGASDIGIDANPDNLTEFGTTARVVDFNNINDDVNSDIITAEYPMSDGSPRQASHFLEGFDAIMDPTLAPGQTFWPDFYQEPDQIMLDAIGWDITPTPPTPPQAFALLSPTNGSTVTPTPTLAWGASSFADIYTVTVDDDPDLLSPLFETTVPDSQTAVGVPSGVLVPNETYYWGVVSANGGGSIMSTPVSWSFTTTVPAPGSFFLVAPSSDAVDVPTGPFFDWTGSSNADSYTLEVDDDPGFGSLDYTATLPATTSAETVPDGTLDEATTYFWRVFATNPTGSVAGIGGPRAFTTEGLAVICVGDANGDGRVDLDDFSVLAILFGSSVTPGTGADFSGNGVVDLDDFSLLAINFGCGT